MKLTQVRFSHAVSKDKKSKNLASFSISLDDQLIVHGLKIFYENNRYAIKLPGGEDKEHGKSMLRLWFSDINLFNQIRREVLASYFILLEDYKGSYSKKLKGKHRTISMEEIHARIESDKQKSK